MASCAVCNATILFGGHRVGGLAYCSARCLLLGRSLDRSDTRPDDTRDTAVREMREDLMALAEDLQRDHELLTEVAERLDFLERAVISLRAQEKTVEPPRE
jgi:hypothetical protein